MNPTSFSQLLPARDPVLEEVFDRQGTTLSDAITGVMLKDMVCAPPSYHGDYIMFRYVVQTHLCGLFRTGRWERVYLEPGPDRALALQQGGCMSNDSSVPYIVRFDFVDANDHHRHTNDDDDAVNGMVMHQDYEEEDLQAAEAGCYNEEDRYEHDEDYDEYYDEKGEICPHYVQPEPEKEARISVSTLVPPNTESGMDCQYGLTYQMDYYVMSLESMVRRVSGQSEGRSAGGNSTSIFSSCWGIFGGSSSGKDSGAGAHTQYEKL